MVDVWNIDRPVIICRFLKMVDVLCELMFSKRVRVVTIQRYDRVICYFMSYEIEEPSIYSFEFGMKQDVFIS